MENQQDAAEWDPQLRIWQNKKAKSNIDIKKGTPIWIFGYGSLCFKNDDIQYSQSQIGYIKGWTRRFWQLSCDHRGTPSNPGLVCTIVSDQELTILTKEQNLTLNKQLQDDLEQSKTQVLGIAFKLQQGKEEELLDKLDFREKGGYTKINAKFYTYQDEKNENTKISEELEEIQVIVYTGNIENPNFAPIQILNSIEKNALIIQDSVGNSGQNIDYFINVYEFLQKYNGNDNYMESIRKFL